MASSKNIKASKMATATRSWTAKPILGPDFMEILPVQEVYVGILKQRKTASIAIQKISTILPGFAHLKRCSNDKLLLAPLHSTVLPQAEYHHIFLSEDQLKDQLKERGFDLSLLEDKFQVIPVPAKVARTKSQANNASKIWPVNFHPDPMIESLINGTIFEENQLHMFEKIMSLVIEAAKLEAVGNEHCTGAAAIVDPEDGRILAISAARIDQHPMWHAAMLAIDLIARLHGGGAWQLISEQCDDATIKRQMKIVDEEIELSSTSEDQNLQTRLKRIKRRYKEETPLCYPRSLSTLSFPIQSALEMQIVRRGRRNNGAKFKKAKEQKCGDNNQKCGPYLCTGYWVFLLMEPCPLCAMALLHSRVVRIFYGTANRTAGILGSRAVLHTEPGLNHRYRVWSGILEQECRQALEEINARASRH